LFKERLERVFKRRRK